MLVFMVDIATAGNKVEHISKCARMEKEKKIIFGLKKKKYMIVKTGREKEEINETVKAEKIQKQIIVLELQGCYPQKMMEKFSSTFLFNFWV